MAAELIGRVKKMPIKAETIMPIKKGCSSVAHMIRLPSQIEAVPMEGASAIESRLPMQMVTNGVTRMSTFVSLLTSLPHSHAITATKYTASGPPAPPKASAA